MRLENMFNEINKNNCKPIVKHLNYPCTNESINAVVAGLDLKPSDIVVSIAGSGDIPLAIAPYTKKVYAVDQDLEQIEFINERIEALKKDEFENFCRDDFLRMYKPFHFDVAKEHLILQKKYFKKKFRKVKNSFNKIEVIHSGILNFLSGFSDNIFDKIYLSNILHSWHFLLNPSSFIKGLRVGGLVYISSYYANLHSDDLSPELKVNADLTIKAGDIQTAEMVKDYTWRPGVFERVK